ncbi:uncharacterized protein EI97DRAFT_432713 [Westerdykella ornata]|uniref:WW-domain-binding protein n=1 Tax=Westerdykella ornata TaxID=318751 RepID=A0A6A6JMC2_WESOR|nr:uncharacterized protein EI97DRAFT_432713 [Westerdykella ornata]KAF2277098.1 hypothetical protein EI97DRAFT_432713 [Westerdykella ornata]
MPKGKANKRNNSWVMLAESGGYTPLPGEQTLFTSPPRTTLSLRTPSRNPPSQAYSLNCSSGTAYLTNRRIIYLPSTRTPQFQSFTVPILNVHDSRVTAPWFGANKFEAVIQPVLGGGIPPEHAALELSMEFKDGGAFDFSSIFERLKERLRQAVEVARESGLATGDGSETGGGRGGGALAGVNLDNVHLEDLPAYEESPRQPQHSFPTSPVTTSVPAVSSPATVQSQSASPPDDPHTQDSFVPPSEPPPGYEEVQRESLIDAIRENLRFGEERSNVD